MGNAIGDYAGFPRTGAGQHEQGAFDMVDCHLLLGIEVLFKCHQCSRLWITRVLDNRLYGKAQISDGFCAEIAEDDVGGAVFEAISAQKTPKGGLLHRGAYPKLALDKRSIL